MRTYQELPPPGGLAHVVECVWVLTPDADRGAAAVARIFPDGASDLVLTARDASVHGPAPSFRLISENGPMVGFRLRRGASRTVLGISPSELQAGPIAFGALWGRRGREFERRLSEIHTPAARSRFLACFLAERVADAADPDDAVLAAVDRIDRAPAGTIRDLSSEVGLSERHLRRRFQDHVGLGIKRYARVARFQRTLDAIRRYKRRFGAVPPGWAAMAYDHGFADQAHLIRETRALAGLTPGELLLTA